MMICYNRAKALTGFRRNTRAPRVVVPWNEQGLKWVKDYMEKAWHGQITMQILRFVSSDSSDALERTRNEVSEGFLLPSGRILADQLLCKF